MKEVFKKNGGSFVTQAAILAAAGLFVRILGFACRVPLTNNLLGDAGNSIYGTAYSLYNFFFVLSSAGMPAAVSKMVAERHSVGQHREAHRVFKLSMLFGCTMGLLCMLLMFFCASPVLTMMDNPRGLLSVQILVPSILIVSVMSVYRGYFQGMGSTVPTAISQIIEGIFNTLFSLLLAYLWMQSTTDVDQKLVHGAAGATAGTTISTGVGLLVMIGFYFLLKPRIMKGIKHSPKEQDPISARDLMKEILRITFPIIAGTAIMTISNLIDIGMVMRRLGTVGLWTKDEIESMNGILQGKVFTITTLPVSISTALATAVIPSIAASAAKKQHGEVKKKINMSFRVAMLISMPSAVGIFVLADPILRLLFSNVPAGGAVLQVGAISIIFLALTQIVTGTLQGIGKVKIPMIGVLLGVGVKIIVNYFLLAVPSINIMGAVIGTICCYIVAGAFDWYMLVKHTKTKPDFMGILVKPLIAAVVMGLAVYVVYYLIYYLLPSNAIATLMSIVVGIVVYFVYMIVLGGLKRDDIVVLPGGKKLATMMERRGMLAE